MKPRLSPYALYALYASLAAMLAVSGCQTVDPPAAQNLLTLHLNDSLKQYDRVRVEIYDRDNPEKMLDRLWDQRLNVPDTDIPVYDMKNLGTDRLIIKIWGYKAGNQLALQTRIFYAPPPEHQSVLHDSVPPLVPQNRLVSLRPSSGVLSPDLNRDSTTYRIKMPERMDSVSFIMTTSYPGVVIKINGEEVASGVATKYFKFGGTPDTIMASVTDGVTIPGSASSRDYQLIVLPTLPKGVSLTSLVPSTGRLSSEFTPEQTAYVLYMPPDVDTVSFVPTPSDLKTQMTVDGIADFPGQKSEIITVAKGSTYLVMIIVSNGTDTGRYQITIDHTQGSSH